MTFTSYAATLDALATDNPDRLAVVVCPPDGDEQALTRGELAGAIHRTARAMADHDLPVGGRVVVGLPNGLGHLVSTSAAWTLGACVLPLNPAAPAAERDAHLDSFKPDLIVADWPATAGPTVTFAALTATAAAHSAAALPDVTAEPGKAIGTGGSTGRPKIIVQPGPWGSTPDITTLLAAFGFVADDIQLLPGPLYHNFGFDWCYYGLLLGHTVVLLERFDAQLAVTAIERHRVRFAGLVPTMMRRIAALDGVRDRDLSSLRTVLHSAGPCPPAVKRAWIDLIGAEKVLEGYGATEGYGNTLIRGDEWLRHPGSVGLPHGCEIRIVGDDGKPLPPGATGEIFLRRTSAADRLVAADAPLTDDGFGSVGDLGWLDADGYLYLADRRVDLIVSGGANIYPAEVEAALIDHPAVDDVAVIGLPDEDWGQRAHAVIALRPGRPAPTAEELKAHCRQRLTAYKAPRTYEFVAALPRDDGGKLRRNALIADRATAAGRATAASP